MAQTQINIDGMHCHACEMRIQVALEDLEGVSKAEANHESGLAEVEYDESKVSLDDMIKAIEDEGFKLA